MPTYADAYDQSWRNSLCLCDKTMNYMKYHIPKMRFSRKNQHCKNLRKTFLCAKINCATIYIKNIIHNFFGPL